MRRIAASKFGKCQPESDRAGPSLPPARRTKSRPEGRPALPRAIELASVHCLVHRNPRALVRGRPAKQGKRALEVVDDFPEDIPVLPGELRVMETYLAAVVDESLEPMGLERRSLQARQPNGMWNREKIHKQLLAGAHVIANIGISEAQSPSP